MKTKITKYPTIRPVGLCCKPTEPVNAENSPSHAPTVTDTGAVAAQPSKRKFSIWSIFFIVVGILQIAIIAVFLYLMYVLDQEARSADNEVGLLSIMVTIMFIVPAGIIASINFFGLPFYLIKRKPGTLGLALGIISFLISAVLMRFTIFPMLM